MKWFIFLGLALHAAAQFQPPGVPFVSSVTVAPGFSASVIFSNLTAPRGITFDSESNLLVVERGFGITAFTESTDPAGWSRQVVIQNPNFTQGIQVQGRRLYASTASQALLFNYDPATKSVSDDPRVVVDGLPADGDLLTHTLQLEGSPTTSIFIGTGPLENIDPTARDPASGRSQIRRFSLRSSSPQTWISGELLAYGIRNPAGFAFSPLSPTKLAIVENGASIDNVTGLTSAFVNDNPADELELVDLRRDKGASFGFPDCSTIWNGSADPSGVPQYVGFARGQQFSLHLEAGRDDAWCAVVANNRPPALSFQAHSVPLDIKFYERRRGAEADSNGAFPRSFVNDAFVSFRGSFNRNPPTGYGVIHIPFRRGVPASQDYSFLVQAANLTSCPGTCIRPVGIAFGRDGKLYVSSDSSRELFVIEKK